MRLPIGSCLHLEVFAYLPCYFSLHFRFVLQGVLTWTEIHSLKWKIDICRHVTRVARSLTVSLRGLWAKWISAFFLAVDESITVSLVKYKLFLILFYENSEFLDLFSMNGWKKTSLANYSGVEGNFHYHYYGYHETDLNLHKHSLTTSGGGLDCK